MSFFQIIRSCLSKPEFWVLTGTTLPPINICWAAGFLLVARVRARPDIAVLSRCMNIQVTYTTLLAAPVICGFIIARWPVAEHIFVPGSNRALAAGLTLGIMGALSLLALVFFNTRDFTESVLGDKRTWVPRLRLFRE